MVVGCLRLSAELLRRGAVATGASVPRGTSSERAPAHCRAVRVRGRVETVCGGSEVCAMRANSLWRWLGGGEWLEACVCACVCVCACLVCVCPCVWCDCVCVRVACLPGAGGCAQFVWCVCGGVTLRGCSRSRAAVSRVILSPGGGLWLWHLSLPVCRLT